MKVTIQNDSGVLGFDTFTYHSVDNLADHFPEVGEAVNEARNNVEMLAALAMAEDTLKGRPSLEELFSDEELSQMQRATTEIHGRRGALVDPSKMSKNPLPKLSSLQAATCTVAASPKRSGRGAKTKANSLHQEDDRLARLYYQDAADSREDLGDARYAYWQDQYTPSEYHFLTEGDPNKGLGSCIIDPDIYLGYRSCCYAADKQSGGGHRW